MWNRAHVFSANGQFKYRFRHRLGTGTFFKSIDLAPVLVKKKQMIPNPSYNCMIEKGFSEGEKRDFPILTVRVKYQKGTDFLLQAIGQLSSRYKQL